MMCILVLKKLVLKIYRPVSVQGLDEAASFSYVSANESHSGSFLRMSAESSSESDFSSSSSFWEIKEVSKGS